MPIPETAALPDPGADYSIRSEDLIWFSSYKCSVRLQEVHNGYPEVGLTHRLP